MQSIPVIDISGRADRVRDIEVASRDIGFMYIAGHGISAETISQVRSCVVDYFALPLEAKKHDQISRGNYRGYIPLGFFSANTGNGAADRYEGYKLHHEVDVDEPICATCDLYGPNKWPEMPGNFKACLLNYWHECDRVATVLLRSFADILGIEPDRFLKLFESPLTNMTLLHYPPQRPDADEFGIHPHKDTDALTIVAPDPVGGLMVKCRGENEWLSVAPPGDALIVNIGDLLELWSGGYFVSTPHKVVNTSGAERYSFPYFAVPRFDTVVEPLTTPQPGFKRASVHVGDASREVWRSNWPGEKLDESHLELAALES
jgi:isopenicillin N synthase-like dioxygenase